MSLQIKYLGLQPYESIWEAMQRFTDERSDSTPDELWVVEHPPVFTQGLNGQAKHLQAFALQQNIPIIQTDRGGQVTYHGPGQIIIYALLDLKRAQLGVRDLVHRMENAIIEFLRSLGISAQARPDAPGVYVEGQKIASLGLKIRKQKSYHGLALNLDMDLTPFSWITPCGLEGIQMTQVSHFIQQPDLHTSQAVLVKALCHQLQPEISP
ncbi:MAG: octanoyltransferase [Thiomicrospira sp.]|nr:MAG: octanoyltransferase [Thiomicrospira sp.]